MGWVKWPMPTRAGPGRIDLYKQKICVRRGIPQEQAVQQLIELIKENGDWKER